MKLAQLETKCLEYWVNLDPQLSLAYFQRFVELQRFQKEMQGLFYQQTGGCSQFSVWQDKLKFLLEAGVTSIENNRLLDIYRIDADEALEQTVDARLASRILWGPELEELIPKGRTIQLSCLRASVRLCKESGDLAELSDHKKIRSVAELVLSQLELPRYLR